MGLKPIGSSDRDVTLAEIVAGFARRRMYDVRDYVASDDIGAAINRAITDAAADSYGFGKPGQVIIPPGTWAQTTEIVPKDGVDLIGSGWGKTILRPQGTIASIHLIRTSGTPLTDVTFADFEIDGSGQSSGTYSSAIKGIFIQYLLRCTLNHIKVEDTHASAIGIDFLVHSVIHDCYTSGAGRVNGGGNPGGNGFGIGTGAHTVEDFTISDCTAMSSARYGIMVETQDAAVASTGARIVGCHAQGNQIGLVDCGMGGATWVGNTSYGNGRGVAINTGTFSTPTLGILGVFEANIIQANSAEGIYYDATSKQVGRGYRFVGNTVTGNGGAGCKIALGSGTSRQVTVENNEFGLNLNGGVYVTTTGGTMVDLVVNNNKLYSNSDVDNVYSGIKIDAPVTRGQIRGNKVFGLAGSPRHKYNLEVASGRTLTDVDFDGNDVKSGAATAPTSYLAADISASNIGLNLGWTISSGSPESAVTAPVSTLYRRTDGGAATSLYVKESGTGNTGWIGK